MTDLFTALDHTPEPPLPRGFIEETLRLARRGRVWRRVGAAFAALVLGVSGFAFPAYLAANDAPPRQERVVLPDRVAGYDVLTASAEASPPGAALLLVQSGSWEMFDSVQDLVIGVDGFTYRKVQSLDTERFGRHSLLSPDGKSVLIAEYVRATTAFLHVDLVTGEVREIALPEPMGVILYAWSPDSRYVAYGQTQWNGNELSNALELEVRGKGELAVLDLATGHSRVIPGAAPVAGAAFAPGSDRLALQMGIESRVADKSGPTAGIGPDSDRLEGQKTLEVRVIDLDGGNPLELAVPSGMGIAPGTAWSPDGRTLALIPWYTNGTGAWQPMDRWMSSGGMLLDTATGQRKTFTAKGFLGWRSADSVLSFDWEELTLSQVPLGGGAPVRLATFEQRHNCEWGTQLCRFHSIQLAAGLTAGFTAEPARPPARGPLPTWLQVISALGAIAVGALGIRLSRRILPTSWRL